jgi:hypothetical protein
MTEDDLFAQLEDIFDGIENEEDMSKLDTMTLLDRVEEYTQMLYNIGEALNPQTSIGRDIHSKRYACQLTLRSRGLHK